MRVYISGGKGGNAYGRGRPRAGIARRVPSDYNWASHIYSKRTESSLKMARIDQVLAEVTHHELRAQLQAEVAALKNHTRFGLVYERHLPETVLVPDTDGLRPGDYVRPRDRADVDEDYRVLSVNGRRATVINLKNGEEADVKLAEVLMLRRFGDPANAGLIPLGSVTRSADRPYHTVIEGENYHALQLLSFIYSRQVDCIYIDPPYNTGARDWTYNNRFVDGNDAYRHSKWLSFMHKRLRAARDLLKPDGVLIVTVDEHEVHHLGVLLEQLFPGAYRQMVTMVTNPKGVTQERFSRVEEYAIFCFMPGAAVNSIGDDLLTPIVTDEDGDDDGARPRWKGLLRSGTNARREDRRRMFYPVLVDRDRKAVCGAGEPLPLDEEPDFDRQVDGYAPAWPVRTDGSLGNWGVSHTTLRTLIKKGYVSLGQYDPKRRTWGISYLARTAQEQIASGVLEIVAFAKTRNVVDVRFTAPKSRRIKTVWHRTTHDAGAYGTDILRALLGQGRRFPFPKSLYLVRDVLAALTANKKDALILDFFAGSGTTLHATCLLNHEDGGRRRCVLVTNNEVDPETRRRLSHRQEYPGSAGYEATGIFRSVTRPRCEAAITGLRSDGRPVPGTYINRHPFSAGFAENVEFFRLDYLDADQVEIGHCFDAIHPLLWMAAGSRGTRPPVKKLQPFLVEPEAGYAILLQEDAVRQFEDALCGEDGITQIFMVTDSEEAYAEMRERVGGNRRTRMLYRDFLRHYRRHAGR